MDGLDLNRMKETLRTSIVIEVALCAHAARQAVSVEQSLEGRLAVLAASIRVNNNPTGHLSSP